MFLYFLGVHIRYVELFYIDWILCFYRHFVKQGVSFPYVEFVGADNVMVHKKGVQILLLLYSGYRELDSFGAKLSFLGGEWRALSAWLWARALIKSGLIS
jgi:hypothetical protein